MAHVQRYKKKISHQLDSPASMCKILNQYNKSFADICLKLDLELYMCAYKFFIDMVALSSLSHYVGIYSKIPIHRCHSKKVLEPKTAHGSFQANNINLIIHTE